MNIYSTQLYNNKYIYVSGETFCKTSRTLELARMSDEIRTKIHWD